MIARTLTIPIVNTQLRVSSSVRHWNAPVGLLRILFGIDYIIEGIFADLWTARFCWNRAPLWRHAADLRLQRPTLTGRDQSNVASPVALRLRIGSHLALLSLAWKSSRGPRPVGAIIGLME